MSADNALHQSDGMRSAAGSPAVGLAAGRSRGGAMVRIAEIKKALASLKRSASTLRRKQIAGACKVSDATEAF